VYSCVAASGIPKESVTPVRFYVSQVLGIFCSVRTMPGQAGASALLKFSTVILKQIELAPGDDLNRGS
jgi:hypothetical protein